jgi:hypothetical protein
VGKFARNNPRHQAKLLAATMLCGLCQFDRRGDPTEFIEFHECRVSDFVKASTVFPACLEGQRAGVLVPALTIRPFHDMQFVP